MIKIKGSGTIYYTDIETACKKYPEKDLIIVIPNTKEQSVEELKKIARAYPNIRFSVTGGLDPSKEKFNNEHYQRRTYYTALELGKIISIYREIEKHIDLSWTETQKAMFIYKELCNKMEYSENIINGKDYARGIGGLLYKKAVCAGFAIIYKEALDRISIECHYQNRQGRHSWNVAKLDGEYRGIELTWDTSTKGENGCQFNYFNRDKMFYQNKHHDIKNEPEEHEFQIVPYLDSELIENYRVISQKRVINIPIDVSGKRYADSCQVKFNGVPCFIRKERDGNIILRNNYLNKKVENKSFKREDGTHFVLVPINNNNSSLNKFAIIAETKDGVKIGKIFSEEDLISLPKQYDSTIANGLLSDERLKRKINEFNGYVGYVGKNHSIYYNEDIEKDLLNVMR